MKKTLYLMLLAALGLAGCTKTYTTPSVITIAEVDTNLQQRIATLRGTITDDGGLEIEEAGICYSTSYYTPDLSDHVLRTYYPGSEIRQDLTGAEYGQTYHFRAYAKNPLGVSYGDTRSFTMPAVSAPNVTTGTYSVSYSGNSATATCQGSATAPSEAPLTQAGICYRAGSGTPTVSNNVHYASGISGRTNASYSCQLTGLSAGTYSYRAFATNSIGTSYGTTRTFTVSSGGGGTGSYTITFNGSSWNAAATRFVDYTSSGYMTIYAYKNSADAGSSQPTNDVWVYGFLESTTGSYTYTSSGGDVMNYRDPNNLYVVNSTVILSNGDTISAGTYYRYFTDYYSFSETITAIDLNARTMSATWSAQLVDIEQYINNNGNSYGTTYSLSGTLSNYHWSWSSSSKEATASRQAPLPDNGIKMHHPKPLKKQ